MDRNDDDFQLRGLRKRLVEELRRKGIKDEAVLDAVNRVPRHKFMDSGFMKFAYKDQAFPIGAGQTISQPFTVAFQTELLSVKPQDKVLEIGTGSGYQAAVLAEMGAKVYTIERHRELFLKAQALLSELNYNISFFYGDGSKGLPTYGPFDRIIITAAAPAVPEALLQQLKIDGRMVLPLGKGHSQTMISIDKINEHDTKVTEYGSFVFVPLLTGRQ
jgi:protein-L-isoaspartate(D-aspartate) O-methyltransferase